MEDASRDGLIDDLYQANHAAVLRLCSSILRNPEDAADAAQEVFLIALESLGRNAGKSPGRGWLLTVARNHCLDLLRRRKRLGKALVTLGPDTGRGTDMENAVADRDFVDSVFKQLSKRERQALWHSAVERRPLADIAARLRLSYVAAAQVLHRARRHAMQVAARLAVVFGVFQAGRQRTGGGTLLAASRLAAVAAVPLILVSVQSSSPVRQPVPVARNGAAATGPTSLTAPNLPSHLLPSDAGAGQLGGAAALPPGSTATLNSATDALRQLLRSVPSVSPVPGTPGVVPFVPALPSPSVVPVRP